MSLAFFAQRLAVSAPCFAQCRFRCGATIGIRRGVGENGPLSNRVTITQASRQALPCVSVFQAARGEPYTLPFTGSTGLVYADDVAAAYESALLAAPCGAPAFTLAGDIVAVDQVITHIGAIVPGAHIDANGAPLPIATAFPADPSLAALLPGLPHTPLDQGLRDTVAFYR